MVDRGFVDEPSFYQTIADALGTEYVDLSQLEIPPEILRSFPAVWRDFIARCRSAERNHAPRGAGRSARSADRRGSALRSRQRHSVVVVAT